MNRSIFVSLAAASLFAAGCAKQVDVVRPAAYGKYAAREAGFSPEQLKQIDANCYMGMPKPNPDWPHGPTRFVVRDGYVLQHSDASKIPLWVCESIEQEELTGRLPRGKDFAPDPELPQGKRAELADYRGSGYDRGHMAPAGNQTVTKKLKAETFYLSNMTPQKGPFNQQVWEQLEGMARDWARSRKIVYAITGGLFYDPEEDDESTADGLIRYQVIGRNRVAVPTHFYKILIAKGSDGNDQALAFVLENRKYKKPYKYEETLKSIRWIEERAGFDFFPKLDPSERKRLEAQAAAALWN